MTKTINTVEINKKHSVTLDSSSPSYIQSICAISYILRDKDEKVSLRKKQAKKDTEFTIALHYSAEDNKNDDVLVVSVPANGDVIHYTISVPVLFSSLGLSNIDDSARLEPSKRAEFYTRCINEKCSSFKISDICIS